ncbi:MAG: efflux family protein [Micavibrio sp.]|nr:efflux family protein [Micavibrio sp.]
MSHFSKNGDLTQGPVRKHLIRMTIPMLWSILSMISVQLVDTYYISRLGTEKLAAMSFTFPVVMIVFSLIIGLGIATSSIIARKIGEKKHDEVIYITSHSILLAVLAGGVMAVAGTLLIHPLFTMMGADETMMPMIRDYMGIWFAGCLVMAVPIVGNSAMRATGDTIHPAIIMIGLSAINAVFAAILIFGMFGFPRMELRGAAFASILSYGIAAIASLCILHFKKKMVFQGSLHLERFAGSAKTLLIIAVPIGLASIIQPVTQAIITAILAGYSMNAVAAFGVVTRVEAMAFVIMIALATGMSPIIGQNWGANQFHRVKDTLGAALAFSTVWSLLVALAMALFATPLAAIFSSDPGVIHYAALYFWIVPVSYAAGNLVMGWSSAYNAIGQPKKALMMMVIKMIVLQIPMALFLARLFGVVGVFGAIAGVNLVTGLFFHLRNWPELAQARPDIEIEARSS